MTPSFEQVGVVVVMESTVMPGLEKLARRHRWPLIHRSAADRVIRILGRQPVDIAVVQVALEPQQAVELIEWLRMTRQDLALIAVTSTHHEEVERMLRHAGVHCYLPEADEVSLERAVADIFRQQQDRNREPTRTASGSAARFRTERRRQGA